MRTATRYGAGMAAALLTFMACAGAAPASGNDAPAHRQASLDGIRVAYTQRGGGNSAVVFVHGWSCDQSFWDAQLDASTLLAGRRLIALDLPGHGASDKPQARYTMDLFARSIAAVLDDAGVSAAVLVGHSNGVPVARQFYRLFPARTRGLVLVDGSLKPLFDDPARWEAFIAPMRGRDYREQAAKFVDGMLQPVADAAEREHIRGVMLATPQHVMVGGLEAVGDPAIWAEDPIHVPLLAVMARSPFWTPEYEAFVRRLAPGADYRMMDGVSHFLMMDRPGEFNDIVSGWLAGHGL